MVLISCRGLNWNTNSVHSQETMVKPLFPQHFKAEGHKFGFPPKRSLAALLDP